MPETVKQLQTFFLITWILMPFIPPSSSALTFLTKISKEMNNVGLQTRAHCCLYQCKGGSKQTQKLGVEL